LRREIKEKMPRLDFELNRVLSILFIEIIALCTAASYRLINVESAIVLLILDFLFVTLAFQLSRTLPVKMGLLALGNLVGLFCNFIFYSLNIVGVAYFGEVFRVFYVLSYPLLNMMWMVTFWSLSLAVLPKPQKMEMKVEI